MEFRESFASKYLISTCTISQNIKMPLLCYIILTMASQWPTKFQVQGQCFKVKQNNQSRKSQKLFIFRASNPSITSHSQCQSKFPKTIHVNRISTKFLIVKHLKDETVFWLKKFPVSHKSPLLWFQRRRRLLLWYVLAPTVHPVYFPAKKLKSS